ncbi:MAG TPA: methylenetetrahydrofolate reductase [Candidatus Altiarchaeales archaeon]|nr:methylenetetrahydrofolate reductase [Candidatus Altiarchaeales archaeon]
MSFRQKLEKGSFVVTGEVTPRKSGSAKGILKDVKALKDVVDAVNVTDNQRACVRASSVAVSKTVLDLGVEPILQATCRDRNRIGLQSDLLGAYLLGLRNVLALTGDHPSNGDNPGAKPVFDLDAVQLVKAIDGLNHGVDFEGNTFDDKTDFFIGAAANPGAEDLEVEILRVKNKIEAGARFFQTQVVYDVDAFKAFMKEVPSEAKILAGIVPLKSVKMANFMNEKVPGVNVPKALIDEIGSSKNQVDAGISQAAEIIREVKSSCSGVHIMALGLEERVKDIMALAGLKGKV